MVTLSVLFAVIVVVASVALIAFAYRRNRREQLRTELGRQCFGGQPRAIVHLATWGLPVADIRSVAGQRGYAETQAPDPSVLVFYQAGPGGTPGVPGVPGVGRAPTIAPRERQRLSQRLANAEFVWVDVADSGGTPADIAALAQQYGAQVLRTYGDRTQPVLLVGKRPIHNVRDVARGGRGLRSWTTHWLARGVGVAALLLAVITGVTADDWGGLTWLLVGVLALAVPAGAMIELTPAFRDTTTRMNRLVREFDGRATLTIIAQHYRFNMHTYLDVAAELGYQELNSMRDWTTSSRWNRSWLRFVRR